MDFQSSASYLLSFHAGPNLTHFWVEMGINSQKLHIYLLKTYILTIESLLTLFLNFPICYCADLRNTEMLNTASLSFFFFLKFITFLFDLSIIQYINWRLGHSIVTAHVTVQQHLSWFAWLANSHYWLTELIRFLVKMHKARILLKLVSSELYAPFWLYFSYSGSNTSYKCFFTILIEIILCGFEAFFKEW